MLRSSLILLAASMIWNIHAENLTAEWDFTKGAIHSTNGKFKAKFRGTTQIAGDEKIGKYLAVGMSPKEKPEGIVMERKYPELSPTEGFRIEAKVRLREQTSSQMHLVIWDSKYVFYNPAKPNPAFNHGVGFFLIREKNEMFRPSAWIGCGEKGSEGFVGKPVKLEEGKVYTLSFSYDGAGNALFQIDGQRNAEVKGKIGAPVSSAVNATVIGDRVGSHFNRFDGDILSVKLFTFPTPTEK